MIWFFEASFVLIIVIIDEKASDTLLTASNMIAIEPAKNPTTTLNTDNLAFTIIPNTLVRIIS